MKKTIIIWVSCIVLFFASLVIADFYTTGIIIHNGGSIKIYDVGDDTSVTLGPTANGTTTLGITGGINVSGNVVAATYGDGSITNAELLYINTLSSNAQTQLNLKAPLINPSFTTPTLGVAGATSLATTANVRIGAAVAPAQAIGVSGDITTGTYQYSLQLDSTLSGTTQSNLVLLGGIAKAATAIVDWASVRIDNAALGGGATITNQYQVYITTPTRGGTSNYSIYSVGGQNFLGDGVRIGADSTNNLVDNSSNGAATADLYIGNKKITVAAFTAYHNYQLGDLDLQVGEAVKLVNRKIYRSTTINDSLCVGIYWGITDFVDSFGTKLIQEKVDYADVEDPTDTTEVAKIDALEQVEIMESRPTGQVTTTYQLDGDTVKAIETPVMETVGTGKFKSQLKAGYTFDSKTAKFLKKGKKAKKKINQPLVLVSDNKTEAKAKDFAYNVAVLGDSYDEHDKTPLTGAWVTVDGGVIAAGDLLVSSAKPGYLQKQSDNIRRNYTVGKAMEAITADTKTAYIYLMQ